MTLAAPIQTTVIEGDPTRSPAEGVPPFTHSNDRDRCFRRDPLNVSH